MNVDFDEWHQIPNSDVWVKVSPDFRGSVKVQVNETDVVFVQSKRHGWWSRIVDAFIY